MLRISDKQVAKVENGKLVTNVCHLTQFAVFEEGENCVKDVNY